MNNILVTGGLGYSVANFIRLLLECDEVDRIVNLDLLTCAGNPENLADSRTTLGTFPFVAMFEMVNCQAA